MYPTYGLRTKEVLAGGDAAGDGEGHLALVGDKSVDTPLATAVQPIFVDLEPLEAGDVRLRRTRNLRADGS